MTYCVYRQWRSSNLQEVLEYFATVAEAKKYAAKIKSSREYYIEIGEFFITLS